MATNNKIEIVLSDEIRELIDATRLTACLTFDCKNNWQGKCAYKSIRITRMGYCEELEYTPRDKPND